ncbi:MAG: transcriptional repressor, partial [Muribaculaceae bacterium]|nr:transcriptional repressor [Muribaculaceae bacterium]
MYNAASRILEAAGITPTPNRILVVDALAAASGPLALAQLEELLPTMERSGIFRVLTLLADSHLAHTINDGTRSLKYELSPEATAAHHVHFHCTGCGRTLCIPVPVPPVRLPAGSYTHLRAHEARQAG